MSYDSEIETTPLVYDSNKDCSTVKKVLFIDQSVGEFSQYVNNDTFAIQYSFTSSSTELMEILRSRFSLIERIGFVFHYSPQASFMDLEYLFVPSDFTGGSMSKGLELVLEILLDFDVQHVDFLACKTLLDTNWRQYFDLLKGNSNAVVSASDDNTGNLKYGGDWILENTMTDVKTIYFNDLVGDYALLLSNSSVFPYDTFNKNQYYNVFYTVSKNNPSVLNAKFYDQSQTLISTQDISFNGKTMKEMLAFLENSAANPYAIGKTRTGFRSMDLTYGAVYKKALKDSQQQSLMTYVNKTFKNVYSNAVTVYEVKVVPSTTTNLVDFNVLNFGGLDQNGFDIILSDNGFDSDYGLFNFSAGSPSHDQYFPTPGDNEPVLTDVSYGSAISFLKSGTDVGFIQKTYTTADISENTVIQIHYGANPIWEPAFVYHKTSSQSEFTEIDTTSLTYKLIQYTINPGDTVRIEEVHGGVLLYAIVLSKLDSTNTFKYMIDDVEQPNLVATQIGTYVFDQSDPSNDGHRLKFRNLSDSTTPYTTNVTHEGTPGTPNSYSIIDVTQDTPDLEYYCENHTGSKYGEFKTLTDLTSYRVKVETNILGDPVFALSPPGTDEYYNQIDVSFGAGSKFLFDVSDPTVADISFVFGTVVDNSSTIIDSFVTYQDGVVILDICSGYVGESLKYFEDTTAGMGYVKNNNIKQGFEVFNVGSLDTTVDVSTMLAQIGFDENDNSESHLFFNGENLVFPGRMDVTNVSSDLYNSSTGQYLLPYAQYQKSVDVFGWGIGVKGGIIGTFTEATTLNIYYGTGSYNRDIFNLKSYVFTPANILRIRNGITTEIDRTWTWTEWNNGISPNGDAWTAEEKLNQIQRKVTIDVLAGDTIKVGDYALDPNSDGNYYVAHCNLFAIEKSANIPVIPYVVTVSGDPAIFYIDGSANPQLTFTSGETYVFYQSHESNSGNTFVLGTVPDSSVNLINYQTIVGTPGQPGAYTSFTASGETVYYYSFETPDMGYQPSPSTVMSFASLANEPDNAFTSNINTVTNLNNLLDSFSFNYEYTNINYEGEGIQRPGGNAVELDSNSYNYTKAITFFQYGEYDGYIEKTVNASGTLKVIYGSANDVNSGWTAAVAIDTGSGYVEVDTANGVEYKEFTTTINAGNKFKVYEKSISVIFLYAIEYPEIAQTIMDFGTITSSLGSTTNANNATNYNATINTFLDNYGFTYNYSAINFTGEGQTIEGVNIPEYSPSDDPYTKAINFFYSMSPHGYIQKTVNSSGTVSVWYGNAGWNSDYDPCYIYKNGVEVDNIKTTDSDNRRRRVDIQVESGDVIKIGEGWAILLLYAVKYPGA